MRRNKLIQISESSYKELDKLKKENSVKSYDKAIRLLILKATSKLV